MDLAIKNGGSFHSYVSLPDGIMDFFVGISWNTVGICDQLLLFWVTGWWFQTCFIFHDIWDVILPSDELIFFRGVGQPPTRLDTPQKISQKHERFNTC